jgi:threonyl-tRNA synthetase
VQAVVMNITDHQAPATAQFVDKLRDMGFRVEGDLRNEKIGFKIRERTLERIPYLLVVGDREVEQNTVAVRTREGKDLGSMSLDAFAGLLRGDIARRGRSSVEN